MSEQEIRRRIAAAKSHLSRLDNQRREVLHSTREDKIDEFRRLTDKRDAQYFKFRELCTELRKYDELMTTTKSNSATGEQETGELGTMMPGRIWVSEVSMNQAQKDGVGRFYPNFTGDPARFGLSQYVHVSFVTRMERDRDVLREALQKILDNDDECHCEHDNENCCELNHVFCPRCIAAVALRPAALGETK